MNYSKVNILTGNQEDFEAKLICFLAKNISLGEYQNNNFLVLPHLEKNNPKTVYFPDLGYSKEFWKAIAVNSNNDLSANYSQSAINEVKNSLLKYKKEKFDTEIAKIKSDWKIIESDFFENMNKFLHFKKALTKVEKINILITPFGTRGSFNPPRVGNKFNLNVTSRVDYPAGNIASGILQNLYIIDTWIGGEIGDEKYQKRMSVMAFLMTSTIFNKYYPDFVDITKTKFTVDRDLIFQANKYLEKLGFPVKEIQIDPGNKIFSKQEEKLLSVLIENKGEVVDFDQVANILWKNRADDKFSLEAIAKVIENLRKKIKSTGINKEIIFTKRGRGVFICLNFLDLSINHPRLVYKSESSLFLTFWL